MEPDSAAGAAAGSTHVNRATGHRSHGAIISMPLVSLSVLETITMAIYTVMFVLYTLLHPHMHDHDLVYQSAISRHLL